MKLKPSLKKYFGYENFLDNQRKVIKSTLKGKDIFVIIPTGGGKSLCYQLPAMMDKEKTTLVISPLCSLIKDQVDALKSKKETRAVEFINGTKTTGEIIGILNDINMYRLIYLTPEALKKYCSTLIKTKHAISRVVIDEAHCISSWGHDFRPSYKFIGEFRSMVRDVPFSAFTATAPRKIQKDVVSLLKMKNPDVFIGDYFRKNIKIHVEVRPPKSVFRERLKELLCSLEGSGIVYCTSRKSCEEYATLISSYIKALPYHAGLTHKKRDEYQDKWSAGEVNIICATIAFGMGINKRDTRWVIHANLPSSLTSYYQEIGRCGRDGLPASCHLFYSYGDKIVIQRMLNRNSFSKSGGFMAHQLGALHNSICFAENKTLCRHRMISGHLGQQMSSCASSCDICCSGLKTETVDITSESVCIMKELKNSPMSRSKLKKKLEVDEYIIIYLILEKYIKEIVVPNVNGFWYENLQLYKKCETVLSGGVKVSMTIPVSTRHDLPSSRGARIKTVEVACLPELDNVSAQLKRDLQVKCSSEWKLTNSRKMLSASTFHRIALVKPCTIDELISIPGVGKETVKRYGRLILDIVDSANKPDSGNKFRGFSFKSTQV